MHYAAIMLHEHITPDMLNGLDSLFLLLLAGVQVGVVSYRSKVKERWSM